MPTNNQEVSTDEEESDDLSTCCICFHPYDDSEREPKYLCLHHHNYCLKCIKVSPNIDLINTVQIAS